MYGNNFGCGPYAAFWMAVAVCVAAWAWHDVQVKRIEAERSDGASTESLEAGDVGVSSAEPDAGPDAGGDDVDG